MTSLMFPFMKFMSWVLSAVGIEKNEIDDEDDEKEKSLRHFLPHRKIFDNQAQEKVFFSFQLNEYYYVRLYPKNLMGVFKNP